MLGKYMGVSATQTIVEYATFAILHLIVRTLTDLQRYRRGVFGDLQLRDEPQRDVQIVKQLRPFHGAVRAAMGLVRCGVRNHGGNRLRHHRHATCDVLND